MKKKSLIQRQKVKVLEGQKDSSNTEQSSYWDDVNRHAYGGNSREHPLANPDILPEMEIAAPSTPQLLMGEAVQHLQGRQKEVYLLTMREGKSLSEAAEILDISKGTAQVYRDRAVKFIEIYCREAIKRGRV